MAMLRPSLTLVLDLDERVASQETMLEIKRSYAHICTPVIRTHAAVSSGAAVRNTARLLVKMGAYRYLRSSDEGADERWSDIVEPWIGNMLHKVGNNMKVFNDRQRAIKLPEILFERADVELQGGELVVGLHPNPLNLLDPALKEQVGTARALVNDGTLAKAVRIDMPSDEEYETQRARAWEAWIVEHPEACGPASQPAAEAEAEAGEEGSVKLETVSQKTREQLLREDAESKSYENTAVPPTDSTVLPHPRRDEPEDEPEQFAFDVDYTVWGVGYADGTWRSFDAASSSFVA